MTWTQLVLTLPGGIRLELLSLYRPPAKTTGSLPPSSAPEVIQTTGTELAEVIRMPLRRSA